MSEVTNPAIDANAPPRGKTRLVRATGDKQGVFTANQETDVRVAITRALAEYLAPMAGDAPGGRHVRFKAVFEEFAEPEERAAYPSIALTLQGQGVYEPRNLAPNLDPKERIPPPDGRYLIVFSDFVQDVSVEVWATSPEDRMAVTSLLERVFNPWPTQYGFSLEMPHYFNARATYSMNALAIDDEATRAGRRVRVATFKLNCRAPLISLFSFPDARPSFDLQTVGDGLDVVVNLEVS